ncbi:MAG: DUF59 domain-containing protein [Armatimonadetes bacterium]|nr:DUF59 domain-containing protein [Armatimonadota bacterium]
MTPQPLDPQAHATQATLNAIQKTIIENDVIEAIRTVYDPEIPVNIYDLGLIYNIEVSDDRSVKVLMTLTSPACPVAEILPGEVEAAVRATPGITGANVELTWDPPFSIDMIPEHIRLDLGLL